MIPAGASCKELRQCREKLMAPRWEALDKVHVKWLLDKAEENGTTPMSLGNKYVALRFTSRAIGFLYVRLTIDYYYCYTACP
jgi:hypothetical protein